MMLRRSIGFNSSLLAIFALITAGVVATTQQLTREPIAESRQRAAQAALYEILPRDSHDNDLLTDTRPIAQEYWPQLGLDAQEGPEPQMHIARRAGKPVVAILPAVAPDGYSGDIEMLVGITAAGEIAGVRITGHAETPGLGDRIELKKSDWILSFDGKQRGGLEVDSNDRNSAYDQLTGATITREAVTGQLERALDYFETARPLAPSRDRAKSETESTSP